MFLIMCVVIINLKSSWIIERSSECQSQNYLNLFDSISVRTKPFINKQDVNITQFLLNMHKFTWEKVTGYKISLAWRVEWQLENGLHVLRWKKGALPISISSLLANYTKLS